MFALAEEGFGSAFEMLVACIISIRTRDETMCRQVGGGGAPLRPRLRTLRSPGWLEGSPMIWEYGLVKTTLEIPDDLFKRTKATAAMRGESLKDFVTEALQAHLERQATGDSLRGWRSVFGQARREDVDMVDAVVAEEFEQVEPDEWR